MIRALPPYIAVVGPGDASTELCAAAEEVGALLAAAGAVLVTGGLGGVMAAASRGAKSAGGVTLGLLPGKDRAAANPWVDIAVATGLAEGRNLLVVTAADGVVAVGGSWGTLSEVALATRAGLPVVAIGGWHVVDGDGAAMPGSPHPGRTSAEAVAAVLSAVRDTNHT
jgi:uncharacterized protein (TIGR00725 family)